MILALIFLIAIALIGARYLFDKAGIYLPPALFKILIGIHLCLFLMTLSTFILSSYNIYWRGYRSTSIIIIATAVTGLLCVWLYKGKPFGLFMIFVFIQTFAATIVAWDMVNSYRKNLYYNDNKYRLEHTDGLMEMFTIFPDLIVKDGLFERKIVLHKEYNETDYNYELEKIKKVVIQELPTQKINIVFTYSIDTTKTKKDTVALNVDLN